MKTQFSAGERYFFTKVGGNTDSDQKYDQKKYVHRSSPNTEITDTEISVAFTEPIPIIPNRNSPYNRFSNISVLSISNF